MHERRFERTGSLNRLPDMLLNFVVEMGSKEPRLHRPAHILMSNTSNCSGRAMTTRSAQPAMPTVTLIDQLDALTATTIVRQPAVARSYQATSSQEIARLKSGHGEKCTCSVSK